MGMLLLLDRLSSTERAVFVPREAFGLPYPEIAEILERTEDSCRQLLSRARRHVATGHVERVASAAQARPLIDAFLAAARGGDLDRLQSPLRDDVVLTSDGNGRARAGRHPIHGAEKAARLFAKVFERFYAGTEIGFASYNNAPALVIQTPVRWWSTSSVVTPRAGSPRSTPCSTRQAAAPRAQWTSSAVCGVGITLPSQFVISSWSRTYPFFSL
jgi:RNA polymerase sigma-70 factor (ECF subfamily)